MTPTLPGRLGDPDMTLASDPRLDSRLAAFLSEDETIDYSDDEDLSASSTLSYEDCLEQIAAMERELDPFYQALFGSLPEITNVSRRSEVVEGADGTEIRLFIHEPIHRPAAVPGVVHTHGGGMGLMSATDISYVRWRDELARRGLCVVGVEFRNSAGRLGNHPFPAGLNDCATAVRWTHQNRDRLGISSLIVSGESGGGNLCLATALKAKQEGWIDRIDGIYSCCPFISGAYSSPPSELTSLYENQDYLLGGAVAQQFVRAYDPSGGEAKNPLAFPYHASLNDLVGLPPHTVSVNELDPLRDEGLAYARRLQAARVSVVSRTVNGTPHAGETDFVALVPEISDATLRDIVSFASGLGGQLEQ